MPLKHWARLVGLRAARPHEYDFGWSRGWTLGPLALSVGLLVAAGVTINEATRCWPVALLLALQSAAFFAGHLIAAASADAGHACLPMVRLLSGNEDLILDAGCGAGRTTLALARLSDRARVVAVDRFDAGYIEGGGERLLRRNLALAGVESRVDLKKGDLLRLPFPDATFDSAASAHALDHLGPAKLDALREVARVLKPGGRFLLVVWVPSWAMFAVGNVLSFALAPRSTWRRLGGEAGMGIVDEGWLNGMWFLLLEKPLPVSGATADVR